MHAEINNIIGLDLGNITTAVVTSKGSEVYESRLMKSTDIQELGDTTVLETEGDRFAIGKGEFENNLFKYDKENFIQLLHYGVANNTTSGNIKLLTGIPASQYNNFKDELKNKIMANNKIDVKINGEQKRITIEEVAVLPEGYGVFKATDPNLLVQGARTIVIDVGGGSTDLAFFDEHGRFIDGDSIDLGLLDLYKAVQSEVHNLYKTYKSIEDIKEYYRGNTVFIGVGNDARIAPTKDIFKSLFNKVVGKCKDIKQYNVIVCGGGAEVFGQAFKHILPQTIINTDISANAKAYYVAGVSKWQRRK